MRELRESRHLTLKYIAAYLGVEFSTLARYERAEWPFRRDHVIALLDVYGVFDEAQRQQLVTLAQDAWRIHQWTQDGHPAPANLTQVDHWWLQTRAEELCVYATMLIPPLLWTPDYAEAVIRRTEGASLPPAKVDDLVRQALARQHILDDKPETRLTVLLEESVTRRPIGGRAVLRQQLDHLARAVERPHVKVRLVPPGDWHDGVLGAFTLCLMRRPYPPVALIEHLGGRLALEAQAAESYRQAFDQLAAVALDTTSSLALIAEAAERLA